MRKFLIVAAALLLTSCSAQFKMAAQQIQLTRDAFNDACDNSRYECRGVPLPVLVVTDLSYWGRGVRGIYAGGPQVYIDDNVKYGSPLFYIVLVHEIVHYLQRFDPASSLYQSSCNREGEAFDTAGRTAVQKYPDQPILDRRTSWWYSYNFCTGEWPGYEPKRLGDMTVPASPKSPIID